ncbi:MAG: Ig-like domain-containing protein, partial [Candidatus Limnocylindrales bacterium]|nr:Ig-like domain-containing protein [Candidatus Limnocylindrales bacterium]
MVGNSTSRRPTRRHAAAIAVVLVAIGSIALSVGLQGQPPRPPVSPSGPPASSPSGPAAAPSAPAVSQWAPLDLSPLEAAATLEPSVRDDTGIPPYASFTLASLTGEPASALAERLEISPPTAFTVVASVDAATATIQPTTALAAGDTYRFALRTPDGATAASWAFRVRGPVTVTSTIPGDATVGVPVRTGIEVTFDQEGVADMADHFSIEPAVDGRFERHGRTQVFVPSELAPATTYNVTVRKGLARTGTDLTLPADVVFRFETEGPGVQEARVVFGRDVIESGLAEPPVIATRAIVPYVDNEPAPAPESAKVRVYRLPSLDSASRALADFLAAPRWTEYSDPLIPTKGLPVVAAFTAKLEPLTGELFLLRFPAPLDEGWYVVEIQGTRP